MTVKVLPINYFNEPGRQNTEEVIDLVKNRAEELNIKSILVASTTGYTGRLAAERLAGFNVIVVSHVAGYAAPNTQEIEVENRKIIEDHGITILTAQHAFAGVNRAIRKKTATYQPNEIIADVLRIFGAGMKVMLEISMMAADAGLISVGQPVIAVAGTHRGADSAAVLLPENSDNFFDSKICEIICMPTAQVK